MVYDQGQCKGILFSCIEAAGDFWEKGKDGKAILKGSEYNKKTGKWELDIQEKDVQLFEATVACCHIGAIRVIKLKE